MAQSQANITIKAPGFGGLNTEISPTESQDAFASVAENCIIDKFGRIGARQGVNALTTDGSAYNGATVEAVHEHVNNSGVTTTFTCADNKIFAGEAVPADVTAGVSITANHWQIVTFNGDAYFVQENHDTLIWVDGNGFVIQPGAPTPQADCATAAYGRLWFGKGSIIKWSALLDGSDFTGGDSGEIDVAKFWPTGYDEITALVAHNNFLIVFGQENILVYTGADGDPAAADGLQIVDTVKGIGCLARDSVAVTGRDVLFLDATGVRSFARTIQEKSMPIGDVSANVRTDLRRLIQSESDVTLVGAVYSPEQSLYIILFRNTQVAYAFSTSMVDERGAMRVTTWPIARTYAATSTSFGRLLVGGIATLGHYDGYTDYGEPFRLKYYTNPLSFGDSSKLKFPKQVDHTILAGTSGTMTVYWAYDYKTYFQNKQVSIAAGSGAEWGEDEYGDGEYGSGVELVRKKTNIGGSGVVVTIGLETDIDGAGFSVQEMNIQALTGRIV